MLTGLSGIAAFERDLILQRTNEGRARAMAEGASAASPKLTKHQAQEALEACGSRRAAAQDDLVRQNTIRARL